MVNTELDQDTLTFIHERATEIKSLMKRTTRNIIEIGENLVQVKQRVGHGRFGEWLKSEFDLSSDTAERYINVAKRLGDIPHGAEFEAKALYLLAAPSTPEEARQEALSLAEAGETISHFKAKAIVERHKADDADLSKLEALAKEETATLIAATPIEETSIQDSTAMRIDDPVELPLPVPANNNKSDLVPFHCLMNHKQREQLHEAINQAKSNYELKTTAEALDTIAQEYLNA